MALSPNIKDDRKLHFTPRRTKNKKQNSNFYLQLVFRKGLTLKVTDLRV